MQLITLSGIDGSGKSTQLALLKTYLEAQGRKVAYFHTVEFSLANRMKRFLTGSRDFTPGQEPAVTEASPFSLFLRKIFLIIDLWRFRLLLRRLRKEHCDFLLSDRYFYDSIINIEFLSGKRSLPSSAVSRFLVKPDRAFYFDITPETVLARERAPEQSLVSLQNKAALFREKVTGWNLIIIDANQEKQRVSESILKALS